MADGKKGGKIGYMERIRALHKRADLVYLLLQGKDEKEIVALVSEKYRLTRKTVEWNLTEARNEIKKRKGLELPSLIALHIQRYEKIWETLQEAKNHKFAMAALRAKENLLGFHKEGFHLRVNQGDIMSVQSMMIDNEYNLDKLTPEKKSELEELLNKCKK